MSHEMNDRNERDALEADLRRCLDDVATEMRARGRDDSRFVQLAARIEALAAPAASVDISKLRSLSERIRPNVEAAPWVCEEITRMIDSAGGAKGEDFRQGWEAGRTMQRALMQPAEGDGAVVSIEAAETMGAVGGPASERERQAFEAWMRGHCWALCATWNGTEYRSDAEVGGRYCPQAASTRQLWAAWRDRAALATGEQP